MVCILYAISIYTLCYSIKWTICLADQWQSLGNQFEIIIIFYNSGHSWGTEMRYLTFPVIISSEFRGNWDYSLEYCTSLSVSSPDFRVVLLFCSWLLIKLCCSFVFCMWADSKHHELMLSAVEFYWCHLQTRLSLS